MDEVKISSDFARGLIAKLLNKLLKSKIGLDLKLDLKSLKVNTEGGKVNFELNATGSIDQASILKLL